MKTFFKKNLMKKLCIIIFIIYILVIFINQQKKISSYNLQKQYYLSKIEDAKEYNESLNIKKDNLDSSEYIEAISREKLDMYSSNERVYINVNK